jgi:hypothetical protein
MKVSDNGELLKNNIAETSTCLEYTKEEYFL